MSSFRGRIVPVERARDNARDTGSNHEHRAFVLSKEMVTPGATAHDGAANR